MNLENYKLDQSRVILRPMATTLPKCPDSPGVKIQSVCPQPGRGVLLSTSKRTPMFIQDIPPVNYFFWALNV